MKYRTKPAEIEALQWSGSNWHEMLAWTKWEGGADTWTQGHTLSIKLGEGPLLEAEPEDWVVRHADGDFSVFKPDIFEATYEPIE